MEQPSSVDGGIGGCSITGTVDEAGVPKPMIGNEPIVSDGQTHMGTNDEVSGSNSQTVVNSKHEEGNFISDDKCLVRDSEEIKENVTGVETVGNNCGVNFGLNDEVSRLNSEVVKNCKHVEGNFTSDDKFLVRDSEEIKETVTGVETGNFMSDDKFLVRDSEEIKETVTGVVTVVNDCGENFGLNDEVSILNSVLVKNCKPVEGNFISEDKFLARDSEEIKETVTAVETVVNDRGVVNSDSNDEVSRLIYETGENYKHAEANSSGDDKILVIKETNFVDETLVNDDGINPCLNDEVSKLQSDVGENYQHVEDNIPKDDECMVMISDEIKETVIRDEFVVNEDGINSISNDEFSGLQSEGGENYQIKETIVHNFNRDDKNELHSINLVVDISPRLARKWNEESEVKNFSGKTSRKKELFKSGLGQEGEFYATDLVWGKVKSHPWWPGQIFSPSDASEKALKHIKRDGFLIAYFGDESFAWSEASNIRPFRLHFASMEKQSSTDSFKLAVNCALEEVYRRIEFGLACACVKNEVYKKIKSQVFVNSGIREESSRREGGDRFSNAHLVVPGKLLRFLKDLAEEPLGETDRLEFFTSKAQLSAFNRWKCYYQLPSEEKPTIPDNSSRKRKKKEKRVSDLMSESSLSIPDADDKPQIALSSLGKKQKTVHFLLPNDSGVETRKNPTPKKFFKVEERQVNHLGKISKKTGKSPRKVNSNPSANELHQVDRLGKISRKTEKSPRKVNNPSANELRQVDPVGKIFRKTGKSPQKVNSNPSANELRQVDHLGKISRKTGKSPRKVNSNPSANELLSSICLAAKDPTKGYKFLDSLLGFFLGFRSSIFEKNPILSTDKKKKSSETEKVSDKPKDEDMIETFVFEGMEDSYWTDRIIQGNTEEQVLFEPEIIIEPEKVAGQIDYTPTALILNFSDLDSVPSETDLNKIFSRYGALNESETEILKKSNRAKVVFKRRGDAETAFSSAGKFSIFGPSLVSYRLNYTPTPRKGSAKRSREGNSGNLASGKKIRFED